MARSFFAVQTLMMQAKTAAMDLMFVADKADQEAEQEAAKLKHMNAPSHAEAITFDTRASQRRMWMAKSELALQVIREMELQISGSVCKRMFYCQQCWEGGATINLNLHSTLHQGIRALLRRCYES